MEDIGEKGVANLIFLGFRNGKRAISNVGFFGDSRPWMLFLKLSRIVGVSRSALPKTIMQLTKNAGLEDDSAFQSGDFLWFPCFFVRGLYVSTVEKFHRGGGATVKHLKIFRLIYNSALETTALPPMRKPEMEGWRDHHHGLFTFCVKHTKWFLKHQKMLMCEYLWK